MANKGNSRHLKAIAAPKYFGIERKMQYYVIRPNPGRHTGQTSIALEYALKRLGAAANKVDVSRMLKSGTVLVNGAAVKEPKYPVGLNDVISLTKEQKSYKLGISPLAKVKFDEATAEDSHSMLCRVVGKYKSTKGAIMVRLHNGTSVVGKNDIHVNDSVVIEEGKVTKVIPLKIGAECTIIDGVHVGESGKIKQMKKGAINIAPIALIEQSSGEAFETLVKNIMVNG